MRISISWFRPSASFVRKVLATHLCGISRWLANLENIHFLVFYTIYTFYTAKTDEGLRGGCFRAGAERGAAS